MSDLEGIRQRRSIRKYKPDPVPREAIEEVLGAAILAPSGKNRQPWKFLVYQGAAKAALLDEMEKGIAGKPAKTRPCRAGQRPLSMRGPPCEPCARPRW